MGKSKELFTRLREEELQGNSFLKEHIIFCTLQPQEAVTTAPNINK